MIAWGEPPLALWQHKQHYDGMPSITIRQVPDDVRDELAARASRAGRSMQEYLRGELTHWARQPDVDDLLERVRARKQTTGSSLPAERILAHRDDDRR